MRNINIGIVGLGTIGGGVALSLMEKKSMLKEKSGLSINLAGVYDIDPGACKRNGLPPKLRFKSLDDMISSDKLDIIVELIGGINPAYKIIKAALKKGKSVVTANKALLAHHGDKLFKEAEKYNVFIGYEASVCGAVPIIKMLSESFVANRIKAIYGIVNGTCNYILSAMKEKNVPMKNVIAEAQAKGIAEANPKLDIDGIDAAHKLSVLTMLAHGKFVELRSIYTEGIRDLDILDIIYAGEWGYDVKLLAIVKKKKGSLELRVHPTLIPASHLLSAVKGENNAVFVKADMIGESMVYGKGAGRYPTASSVISDIVDLASKVISDNSARRSKTVRSALKIKKIGELVSRYYLRFSVIDKPGVLSAISTILARHKISIATVSQKERKMDQVVPLVILTHEAREADMESALRSINKLKIIRKKTIRIRIER